MEALLSLFFDLLAKGFFPQELPPCFSTHLFSAACAFPNAPIPDKFLAPDITKATPYSYARGGNGALRRPLSILNPVNFYAIAWCVSENWPAIDQLLASTTLSQSRPMHWIGAKRALATVSYAKRFLAEPRARLRSTNRVFLLTDISQFYHSIYTHSIAWAMHTKAVGKANHSPALFGNKLDSLIQKSQDNQTRGIAIGPDTSLVIAESVLTRIEEAVITRVPSLKGLRFIDDYELYFSDYGQAEAALSVIQEEMQHFELQLNSTKTKMTTPPLRLEPDWVGDFRTFSIRNNNGQHGDLIRYFDLITSYLSTSSDEHIAKYAASKLDLDAFIPLPANAALYQALLCQLLLAQPAVAKEVVNCLLHQQATGLLDFALLSASFSEVISKSARLGHHFEVSWLLYGTLRFSFALRPNALSGLEVCDNAVIGVMTLNALHRGLLPGLNPAIWAQYMTSNDLLRENWLLSYEASLYGWLPSMGAADHIAPNPAFSFLRSQGVHFYTAL